MLNGFCVTLHYVLYRLANLAFFTMMDDEKYKTLFDAINSSKQEVEGKLTEFWKEMTQAQQRTLQELASKLNKSPYQFRRKGNEVQFQFNATMEDSIGATKKKLSQFVDSLTTSSEGQKESLKRTIAHLDDGIKAITKRQKHIKIADHSDYGWATVQAYDMDDLVSS